MKIYFLNFQRKIPQQPERVPVLPHCGYGLYCFGLMDKLLNEKKQALCSSFFGKTVLLDPGIEQFPQYNPSGFVAGELEVQQYTPHNVFYMGKALVIHGVLRKILYFLRPVCPPVPENGINAFSNVILQW
jgi:hypothetical protein